MTDAVAKPDAKSRSELGQILIGVARDPLGLMGLIIVGTIVFCAIFAAWIVPYDPIAMNIKDRMQGPSMAHFLGTDQLGRDTFSRVIMGGQVALKVALPAIFGAMAIGLTLVVIHLVGINVTGVSVNPARSIGPALFVGGIALSQLWLFIVAPIVGAVAAGLLYASGLLDGE